MTLVRVAKEAGVSKGVVSDILSGSAKYSYRADTVQRVLDSAKALGYQPHSAAALMRAKRTYLIGILAQRFSNEYSALLRDALVQAVQEKPPYKPFFVDPSVLGSEGTGHAFGFEFLEGLFWSLPTRNDALLKRVLSFRAGPTGNLQVVTINRSYSPDLPVSSVLVDGATASCEAAEHLIRIGHRRIAILYRSPRKNSVRFIGFQRAMQKHGLDIEERYCLALSDEYEPDSCLRDGEALTKKLVEENPQKPPTAVLCHNDEVAAGALQAAYQLGLKVPDDLSVVGFGVGRASRFAVPPLTSVVEPVAEIAATAVELMVRRLEKASDGENEQRFLSCKLNLGKSCASPREVER